jgi:hypothetical protein
VNPLRFRCIPIEWRSAPELQRLRPLTVLVFVFGALSSDRHWRLPDDPQHVRSLCFPARDDHRTSDVARCLDELLAVGAFVRKRGPSRTWLEIADHLRYEKGKEPSWGEDDPIGEQQELRMEPMLLALDDGRAAVPLRGAPVCDGGRIPVRVEVEKRRIDTESARAREVVPMREQGTRMLCDGVVESDAEKRARGVFAADEEELSDPLWRALCSALGGDELRANGKQWKGRFVFCRDTIRTILVDFNERGGRSVPDPARWLNKAWMNSPAQRRRAVG